MGISMPDTEDFINPKDGSGHSLDQHYLVLNRPEK